MTALLIFLSNYAWLAGWLVAALLPGVACWGLLNRGARPGPAAWPNLELALFFGVCTGLAVQILILIVLGLLGLLSPLPILLALVGAAVLGAVAIRLQPGAWAAFAGSVPASVAEWLKIAPIVLLILPFTLIPLGPPGGSDALTYHLPYARFYLQQGGLAVDETLRFPLHAHNINLLYSVALIRPGAELAQMLHAAFGFLAMLGVYGIARHWQGWATGLAAAGGMLLLGEFVYSFSTAFVDNGAMLFITAAFLAVALWSEQRERNPGLLWLCALFAGSAMGSKYLGALFTVPLGLMVLGFSRDLRLTVRFALAVSAFGLFWYVRSWWISGNPVHPFLGDVFGHYLWTAEEVAGQMRQLESQGIEKTWQNFLLLGERLFTERPSWAERPGWGGIVVGAFMAGTLLIFRQRPFVKALHVTCLAYLLFWFLSSQVIRYLMLAFPLMSLCAALAFGDLFLAPARTGAAAAPGGAGRRRVVLGSIALALALIVLAGGGVRVVSDELRRIPLEASAQEEYLVRTQPAYEMAQAAVADPRVGDGPILQFRLDSLRYFFPGVVYGDWMGAHSYLKYGFIAETGYWEINDSATLFDQVIGTDIRAVAMNKNPDVQFRPQEISSYRTHFDILLETEHAVLMAPRRDALAFRTEGQNDPAVAGGRINPSAAARP